MNTPGPPDGRFLCQSSRAQPKTNGFQVLFPTNAIRERGQLRAPSILLTKTLFPPCSQFFQRLSGVLLPELLAVLAFPAGHVELHHQVLVVRLLRPVQEVSRRAVAVGVLGAFGVGPGAVLLRLVLEEAKVV